MTELRSLYLHQNCITRISGLETLQYLDNLNLSENFISRVEGIDSCIRLTSLNLAKNELRTIEDVIHLVKCPSLVMLDISDNKIEDPSIIDSVLVHLPELRLLRMEGNPVVRKIPHYRKTLIGKLKNLRHLDSMPIFDRERRLVDAWTKGGVEEEKLERERIVKEERERDKRNHEAFEQMIAEAKMEHEEEQEQGEMEEENEKEEELVREEEGCERTERRNEEKGGEEECAQQEQVHEEMTNSGVTSVLIEEVA